VLGSGDRLQEFCGWPLLPTCKGTLCILNTSGGTVGHSKVVDGAAVLRAELKVVLEKLGVRMLDSDYVSRRERLGPLVQRADLRGVLRALDAACGASLCASVEGLSADDKRELRAFLLSKKWQARDECSDEGARTTVLTEQGLASTRTNLYAKILTKPVCWRAASTRTKPLC
jgi:hypothetical protein